jgi:hypothetical protein
MPFFANCFPVGEAPAPVVGWYDTTVASYPTWPPAGVLVEVTPAEWRAHLRHMAGWTVLEGKLVPPDGVLVPDPQARAPDGTAVAPELVADELTSRIAAGITVTSKTSPAAIGQYPLLAEAISELRTLAQDFASGIGLPGGRETAAVSDQVGHVHALTGSQVVALYQASRDLVHALCGQAAVLESGGTPEWPPQVVEIA